VGRELTLERENALGAEQLGGCGVIIRVSWVIRKSGAFPYHIA